MPPRGRRKIIRLLMGVAAWAAVLLIYSFAISLAHIGPRLSGLMRLAARRREPASGLRLLLTGTFYNVGWFRSHVTPLSRCQALGEIIVVSDQQLPKLPRVRVVAPPGWLRRIAGVAIARGITVFREALRERPELMMGYHIMPNALLCLAAGRLVGAQVFYQMTGGPTQLLGGGNRGENALLRKLTWASPTLQRLAFHAARCFDAIVVRGAAAAAFLKQHNLARRCLIIPGSVDCMKFAPFAGSANGERTYDLICVARLVPVKGYERLLPIIAALHRRGLPVRLAAVGDGPLEPELRAQARSLGIASSVEFLGQRDDVPKLLPQARAFVLTSRIEGLSIAMMEALAAGLPVFAPRIGELGELLLHGTTGLFIDPDRPGEAAAEIASVLADDERLTRMSLAAHDLAVQRVSLDAVAELWERALTPQPEWALSPEGAPAGASDFALPRP